MHKNPKMKVYQLLQITLGILIAVYFIFWHVSYFCHQNLLHFLPFFKFMLCIKVATVTGPHNFIGQTSCCLLQDAMYTFFPLVFCTAKIIKAKVEMLWQAHCILREKNSTKIITSLGFVMWEATFSFSC